MINYRIITLIEQEITDVFGGTKHDNLFENMQNLQY